MDWNKKSELTYGILKTMYCRGGTDITGEWIPSHGQYYDYINNWIYNINHDLPQYSCGYYYELNKDLDSVFAWKYDLSTWGYTASGVKDKMLIDKMIDMIKDIPKYQRFNQ